MKTFLRAINVVPSVVTAVAELNADAYCSSLFFHDDPLV